jgi:hypothetical protein
MISEFLSAQDAISKLSFASFLLDNGQLYKPAPLEKDITVGEPRECYKNATMLAVEHPGKYVYCEGYAVCDGIPIPIEHAWVIDRTRNNVVVDNTWTDYKGVAYFGVEIELESLIARLSEQGIYGYFYMPNSWINQEEEVLTLECK